MQIVLIILQFFIAYSIFNVWVLRYKTMAADFQTFGYPIWMRNIIGAIKVLLAVMLIYGIWHYQFAVYASIGIAVMMIAAVGVHLVEKDPMKKLMPAIALAVLAIIVAILTNYYKFNPDDVGHNY
jgi:hypothetical protein